MMQKVGRDRGGARKGRPGADPASGVLPQTATSPQLGEEADASALVRAARALYRALSDKLRDALLAPGASAAELVRTHAKTLLALIEADARLSDRGAADGSGVLDLSAARREIDRRLDRLASKGAPRALAGEPLAERDRRLALPLGGVGAHRTSAPALA